MSKQSHTPGPWIVVLDTIVQTENGKDICDASTEANALLIAAAPEMLEALLHLKSHFSEDAKYGELYQLCKTAIAKARGES